VNRQLVRVSNADRERVVGILREHLAEGRLTLEEFTERVSTSEADASRVRLRTRAAAEIGSGESAVSLEADVQGLTVFGHRNANGNDLQPVPGAPLVRLVAFGLFTGIDLWRVPAAWAKRGWSEVIRAIERGEHKELVR
jgi:hypothetical protein